ncbi:MAG: DUF2007 domain-containing protein [Kiritimatiellaeota bacterium]|nr:DUF2007 domain-containing protein [Kiritimatiellota bacterium]
MKTLASIYSVTEADMIGMRLRARGIPFFARDLPFPALSIGGIDIQVNDEDYERAKAVLADDGEPPYA